MDSFAPSYLFKNRFGIFYFRVRIPNILREKYCISKVELRKSLGTPNRSKALRLARTLWVKLMASDFGYGMKIMNSSYSDDQDIEEFDKLLKVGRELYLELRKIESNPLHIPLDIDDFKDCLSVYERKALMYAEAYFSNRSTPNDILDNKTSPNDVKNSPTNSSVETSDRKCPAISEAFSNFYKSTENDYSKTTKRKLNSLFKQFLEIVGDKPCNLITIDDLVNYKNILVNLPTRYDIGQYKGKSVIELSKMNIPAEKRATHNTLSNKFSILSPFLEEIERNSYINFDPHKPFEKYSKKKRKGSGFKKTTSFSSEDLKNLFESKEYQIGNHKSPAHHWIPLIGLFTGARLNEICQLNKSDIKEQNGIHYFDFFDLNDDQNVKTESANRMIPIHKQLIKLGFLKYCASIEDQKLFPILKETSNGYSDTISKWFNRTYKNRCSIQQPKNMRKVFHSFRNTFIDNLKQMGIQESYVKEIVGHDNESITFGHYANELTLPLKKKIIDKVEYPSIDFTKIRKREWHKIK